MRRGLKYRLTEGMEEVQKRVTGEFGRDWWDKLSRWTGLLDLQGEWDNKRGGYGK